MPATATRTRRSPEHRIADLQAEIAALGGAGRAPATSPGSGSSFVAPYIHGPQARYDFVRSRCEDGTRPNTAYIERLNLLIRRCCSHLHRRTPGRARNPVRLSNVLEILRVHYNFIRRHSSLRFGSVCRTPAMQLDLFPRPLTFREIMSWVARPSLNPPRRSLLEWTTPGAQGG